MPVRMIVIRHGQTDWNRHERFRGQFDIPLNVSGLEQAQKTADLISKRWQLSAVYSSPLTRATQTAKKIADTCGVAVENVHGLTDIDYGEWQGLTPNAVSEKWPSLYNDWCMRPGSVQIPGGETLADIQTRALEILKTIYPGHQGQEIVLLSHTVVIRVVILSLLGADLDRLWQVGQDPCAINLIDYTPENPVIVSINQTNHLLG